MGGMDRAAGPPGASCGPRIVALIALLFEPGDRDAAVQLLATQCNDALPGDPDLATLERCRCAALRLADGRLDGLRRATDLARLDGRDLLMAAGFGHDPQAHVHWCAAVMERREPRL